MRGASSLPGRKYVPGKREGGLSGMASRTGGMNEARTSSLLGATWESRRAYDERRAEQNGDEIDTCLLCQSAPNELGYGPRSRRPLARQFPISPRAVPSNTISLRERTYAWFDEME